MAMGLELFLRYGILMIVYYLTEIILLGKD